MRGRLSEDQNSFIRENRRFWSRYFDEKGRVSDSYVLVDAAGSRPATYMCNAALGMIAAHTRQLRPLFLVKSLKDSARTSILQSYPHAAFIDMSLPRYRRMKLGAAFQAYFAYAFIRKPSDILEFSCDGIAFGDALHDEVLALGYASIDRIDRRLLKILKRFYYLRSLIHDLLKSYDIRLTVFAHTIGLRGAVLSRYCLRRNIEVLHRAGSYQIILGKYRCLNDLGHYPLTPRPQTFRILMDRKDEILKRAEEYLEGRFSQKVVGLAVQSAFDQSRRTYRDKRSFCMDYGLDEKKPLVFVMLHAFNDYPHSHFYEKRLIFQDYCDWFRRTLRVAQTVTDVNWIFKEHPTNRHYETRDLDLDAVFREIRSSHIRFLAHDADFNARSLCVLAHAIITCIGPAGLEYAAYGIPCILGGGSGYHGFGFTVEPGNLEEYEFALRRISELKRLSEEQVETAKLVGYFYFYVMQNLVFSFCPVMNAHDVWKWDEEDDRRFWREAVRRLQDPATLEAMCEQGRALSEFIQDHSSSQFYDCRQFPFLKPVNKAKPEMEREIAAS